MPSLVSNAVGGPARIRLWRGPGLTAAAATRVSGALVKENMVEDKVRESLS